MGTLNDHINSIQQTHEGGYILTGYTNDGINYFDAWIMKIDEKGIEQWNRSFGENRIIDMVSILQTTDKGYILSGSIYKSGRDHRDALLIKTDSNGYEEWNRILAGEKESKFTSIQQTQDSGFIVSGLKDSSIDGRRVGWLVKTDSGEIEQWNRTFIMEENMELNLVKQTSDGGFMLLAGTRWYTELIKTDKDGIIQWEKSFGGHYIDLAASGQQTKDGGYVIAGSSWRIIIFHVLDISNGWLIKIDDKGNEMWNKNLRKSFLSSVIYSGQQTSDDGYIFAGTTGTYRIGDNDVWLIKLNKE